MTHPLEDLKEYMEVKLLLDMASNLAFRQQSTNEFLGNNHTMNDPANDLFLSMAAFRKSPSKWV